MSSKIQIAEDMVRAKYTDCIQERVVFHLAGFQTWYHVNGYIQDTCFHDVQEQVQNLRNGGLTDEEIARHPRFSGFSIMDILEELITWYDGKKELSKHDEDEYDSSDHRNRALLRLLRKTLHINTARQDDINAYLDKEHSLRLSVLGINQAHEDYNPCY